MFTFQLDNTKREILPAPHRHNGSCRYVQALAIGRSLGYCIPALPVITLVTHANIAQLLLFGARNGYMPPQLKSRMLSQKIFHPIVIWLLARAGASRANTHTTHRESTRVLVRARIHHFRAYFILIQSKVIYPRCINSDYISYNELHGSQHKYFGSKKYTYFEAKMYIFINFLVRILYNVQKR